MKKLILASASKRRYDLLNNTGYDFDVLIPDADENITDAPSLTPEQLVTRLAQVKALAVVDKTADNAVIIAADTVVALNDNILGKPKDENDAFAMLHNLSGKVHRVYTGVFIYDKQTLNKRCFCEFAAVHMSVMTDDEIQNYIKTGQPMDKAGSYGIQGIGGLFISHIEGDFFAVEGLPINKVYNELKAFQIYPEFKNTEYI